jgi:hypothetical protein
MNKPLLTCITFLSLGLAGSKAGEYLSIEEVAAQIKADQTGVRGNSDATDESKW